MKYKMGEGGGLLFKKINISVPFYSLIVYEIRNRVRDINRCPLVQDIKWCSGYKVVSGI